MQAAFPLPEPLRDRYLGWHVTPVDAARDLTVVARLDHPDGRCHYVKVLRGEEQIPVRAEVERLRWAFDRGVAVPRLVEWSVGGPIEWMVTEGIDALSGIDPDLLAQPEALVPALARGLRRLHETAAADCPFDFRLDVALEHVARRVAAGLIVPARDFHPEHAALTPKAALDRLRRDRPPSEEPVLSHGDPCFPNYLLRDREVIAYVDIAEMGLADRWSDVAVASWSTTWNVGPGFEDLFVEAYGLRPDRDRLAYFRLLYDCRA